jgi:flagellar hook-associated protein 3 FlgL
MNVRVTGQSQVANALAHLRAQSASTAKYEKQITSGKRVVSASDDPIAFSSILQAKAVSDRSASHQRSLADASSELDAASSALQDVNRILVRTKQLAQEGANSTTDANAYENLANEVDTLFNQLLDTANSQIEGRYLFGGTADNTAPFRVATQNSQGFPATVSYDGAQQRSRSLISTRQTVETKYIGSEVFQVTGAEVFESLIDLRNDFRNSTLSPAEKATTISARLGQIETARNQIGDVISEQGSAAAGLDAIQARLETLELNSTVRRSELESTDYAEAIVRLKEQQTTFEATLAVTSRLLQPTLLDFIR